MKTQELLLSVISLPVILLWFHASLLISSTVEGLIRVIVGITVLFFLWLLKKYWSIDYILSVIVLFIIFGVLAQLGLGLFIESFTLIIPLLAIYLLFHYKNKILAFLMSTVIYIYSLIMSFAASIGLSFRSALAIPSIVASISRLVVTGRIPVTVYYEPIPGLTIMYAASIIALTMLLADSSKLREIGDQALGEAVKLLLISLLISLIMVYIILITTRVYVFVWSITTTAIFIISYIAYRLLARDAS